MDRKTIVIALGGNAILQPKQQGTAGQQMENVRKTCFQIAYMIEMGHRIILTHGNGPQVGNILIQNNTASAIVPAMPLYICGAQSQGLIGYMMQQQLGNILRDKGIEKPIVTIVSQMVVDKDAVRDQRNLSDTDNPRAGLLFPILSTTVYDPNGNSTVIEFNSIRVNRGLSDSFFNFIRPAGVEVVKPQDFPGF